MSPEEIRTATSHKLEEMNKEEEMLRIIHTREYDQKAELKVLRY